MTLREGFGASNTGAAFECDGYDLCLLGEGDEPEIRDVESDTVASSLYRARTPDGKVRLAAETVGECYCVESGSRGSAANGPIGSSGQVNLIDGLALTVKDCEADIRVQPYIQWCGWEMWPEDPRSVGGYVDWTITNTANEDDKVTTLTSNRCVPAGYGRTPFNHWLGCFDIAQGDTFTVTAEAGFQYFSNVASSFDSNLTDMKIYFEVCQLPNGVRDVGRGEC
jgi:hypothetical protein